MDGASISDDEQMDFAEHLVDEFAALTPPFSCWKSGNTEWRSPSFGGDVKPSVPMTGEKYPVWFSDHFSKRAGGNPGDHPLQSQILGPLRSTSERIYSKVSPVRT